MSPLSIIALSFKAQKFFRRYLKLAFIHNLSISFRKSQFNHAFIHATSNELLEFNTYKSDINHYRTTFEVKNAILNTKSGVIWFESKIVEESTVWRISDLILWEPKPILKKKLTGNFNNLPDNGYFHFLIEDLPRFLDTTDLNLNLTTIYGSKSSYIQESLNILRNTKNVYFDYPVLCENLVTSEKTSGGIFTQSDHGKLLNFSKNIEPKMNNKNVFITRKNRLKGIESRGIQYIDEIESLFARNSFEVIAFEELSLVDQISTIKNAQVVAGFHGAGLANIVWSKNKCKVVEISESRITNHFKHLASICKHEYRYVKASELVNYSKNEFESLVKSS